MKYTLVFTALIAAVCASPLGSSSDPTAADAPSIEPITTTPIPILKQELSVENGAFVNNFETGHGIVVNESGNQKQIGTGSGTVSSGSFSFTNPEGAVITVTWIANENGFQATGDHLPTPPPTPEHVVKMLADMEAAVDAISIATEKPVSAVVVAEGNLVEASQDPVPAASSPAQDSMVDAAPAEPSADAAVPAEAAPVEAAPAISSPAETVPVQNSLDDSVPAEDTPVASAPVESAATAL